MVAAAIESTGRPSSSVTPSAGSLRALTTQEAGEAFLSGYVESDGRVTRRDEGGDTVSEGQAYAMLVAAALNDQQHFTTVWAWTKRNLGREDGLLVWRWKDGQVVDNASASDADLDAARALVVAAAAFGDDQLKAEGVRLGTAVLDKETVMTKVGQVQVAGSWANHPPYAYNPSYTSPAANALLADATDDERWAELDLGTRAVTTALLNSADLPPTGLKFILMAASTLCPVRLVAQMRASATATTPPGCRSASQSPAALPTSLSRPV